MIDNDFCFVDHLRSVGIKQREGFFNLRTLSRIFGISIETMRGYTKGRGTPPFPLYKMNGHWKAQFRDCAIFYASKDDHVIRPNILPFHKNHNGNLLKARSQGKEIKRGILA